MDLFAIENLADAEKAITTIKQQGKGTSTSPVGDPGDPAGTDNLAHYYKFAEIYHGHKLIPVKAGFKFEGDAIPFPDVFPMVPVPPEGYHGVTSPGCTGSSPSRNTCMVILF